MTDQNKPQSYSMGQFQVIVTPNNLITYTHPKTGLSVWTSETEKPAVPKGFQNNFHLLEIADAREKMEHLQVNRVFGDEDTTPLFHYMINALNEHIVDMEFNAVRYMREGDAEWNKQIMGLRVLLIQSHDRERKLKKQLKAASNHGFYASLGIIMLLACLVYALYHSSSTL